MIKKLIDIICDKWSDGLILYEGSIGFSERDGCQSSNIVSFKRYYCQKSPFGIGSKLLMEIFEFDISSLGKFNPELPEKQSFMCDVHKTYISLLIENRDNKINSILN
jgi:hypothetical protein